MRGCPIQIVDFSDVPETLEALAGWHQAQWGYLYPGRTLAQRIEGMRDYLSPDFLPSTFVAMADGVIGSAAIVPCDMEERAELSPWLASVYVAPSRRGQGVGSALVRHVMEAAAWHGYGELFLFTPDRESFYRRLGWRRFETLDYHGASVVVMRATLARSA
ncbi:MAG: GNAT family N-acetyltransferase [Thiotrichales bacterium]